jgi:DNA-binding SARP family transcriptional activator
VLPESPFSPILERVKARISLLGKPQIHLEDEPTRLSGRKPWGLLAYLLLESRPPTRRQLAELLFAGADDPLGALRWSLFQVRKALGPEVTIRESDGALEIVFADIEIDALDLLAGRWTASLDGTVGSDLLGELDFGDAPTFDDWLLLQRSRVSSASVDMLRWAATSVAKSDPDRALTLIDRAKRLDPFDDALHELVVQVHVARDDRGAALAYIERVDKLYHEELGVSAPDTISRPLDRPVAPGSGPLLNPDITARALLNSASARFEAGDYEGALETARRASSQAARAGDTVLECRALVSLAEVLIHTLRGRDKEALGLLGHALELALKLERADLAADVERELGYVAVLDARYGGAEASLTRSIAASVETGDQEGEFRALIFRGMSESDRCDLVRAEASFTRALELTDVLSNRPLHSYALASLARTQFLAKRYTEARATATAAVELAREAGAVATLPWALVWAGSVEEQVGEPEEARAIYSEAYALGCEIVDPCWEALALRGLARLDLAAGDRVSAESMLEDALERSRRLSDTYKWAEAVILTDLAVLQNGSDPAILAAARALTTRAPMPDLVARLKAIPQTPPQTLAP